MSEDLKAKLANILSGSASGSNQETSLPLVGTGDDCDDSYDNDNSSQTPSDKLKAILEQPERSSKSERKDAARDESRSELKRVNATLSNENNRLNDMLLRSNSIVRGSLVAAAIAITCSAGMFLYMRASAVKHLNRAFKIIHYREERALSANALVLDEWAKRLDDVINKVNIKVDISEEEKTVRMRTLVAARAQAINLKEGFLKQLQDNDKERGTGASFSYKDPFLKREIQLSEENGGLIDLEKLKNEIKDAAKIDETMRAMEEAMYSTIPLVDQVREEARQQHIGGEDPKQIDLTGNDGTISPDAITGSITQGMPGMSGMPGMPGVPSQLTRPRQVRPDPSPADSPSQ